MARLDTSLEAAGAEFLVLGNLLITGVQSFKAYTNFPGYDIIATNPHKNLSCRIQVKSRWATDFDGGFLIKNFECDIVVLVALNRGYRGYKSKKPANLMPGKTTPEFYIFPVEVVKKAQSPTSTWGKAFLRNIEDFEKYKENWAIIKQFLKYEESDDLDLAGKDPETTSSSIKPVGSSD